jgi:DNA-directed RNA polymerase specialized sigma24 family protein
MAVASLALGPGIEIVPDADDPLVLGRAALTREMLRVGIRGLSQLQRDTLRLATRDGRDVTAIATELGMDVAAVEDALRTGLLDLRTSLVAALAEHSW